MNESLCHALIAARLSEEDVAARLEVDPKTVRRWMEGRLPYLRHRWALAAMLGVDEADLWPGLRSARSQPQEVRAIYPHRDAVPHQVWLRLFGSAAHEIGILSGSGLFLAEDPDIIAALGKRAQAGVRVRICVADPDAPEAAHGYAEEGKTDARRHHAQAALARYAPLRQSATVEIRLHRAVLYSSVFRADDQLMVSPHAYGIPAGQAPALYLQRAGGGDMVATYLDSFDRVWADARPLE